MDVDPIELQRYLKGAQYPATKDELLELADENDAPEEIVDAIRDVAEETFDGPDEVVEAIS